MSLHPCLQYGGIREERAAIVGVRKGLATGRGCDGRVARRGGAKSRDMFERVVSAGERCKIKSNELYRNEINSTKIEATVSVRFINDSHTLAR